MKKGFSTIELLIAMAIGLMTISAVLIAGFGDQSLISGGQINSEAVTKAQQLIEQEQALAREDFNLVNPVSTTTDGIYQKSVSVTLLPDYVTKLVTTLITWTGEKGQTLYTKLSSLVTNLENVNSPNVCNSSLVNVEGWKNPQDTAFDFQQLLYGNNSTGLSLSSIYVFNKKIYVTASSPPSNPNDSETFFILDVSDITQPPQFLGKVDNNASSTDGLNAISVASSTNKIYAYVANAHDANFKACTPGQSCSQLQVIDAITSATPSVVASANFLVPTSTAPYVWGNTTPNSGQAVGSSIFYKDGYVYLGLSTTLNGPSFHIIDVHDPLHPAWVGSWPTSLESPGAGSSGAPISSIVVKGKYAYIAHPNGLVGATSEQMTVLDVSNPANPFRVSGYSNSVGIGGNGKSLMIIGTIVYFGRTASNISGSADSIPEFYILNDTDPTSVSATPYGSVPLATSESINSLVVRDYLAFLLTTTEFKVLNISNMPSPFTWGTLALPGNGGSAFDCQGDRLFIIHDVQKDHVSVVTPATPIDYTLSNTGNITVNPGSSGATTITNTSISGSSLVTLSASGLPAGATVAFSNNPCIPTCLNTLTISTTAATTPGTYPITVTGSPNGTSNPSTTFNLIVNTPFDYSLSNTGMSSVKKGNDGTTNIIRTLVSGATTPVTVSVSGLPAHASVSSISNNPCGPTCASVLTIHTQNSATPGTYTITVTGLPNGTGPRSTAFTLTITN